MIKQTKLKKVIKWINGRVYFRWKTFSDAFEGSQTCLTYLCYLKNAGYVSLIRRGQYLAVKTIPKDLQHDILYFEAYGSKRGERTSYDDAGGGIDTKGLKL